MNDIAIRVEDLGKQYRIGALQKSGGRARYRSLRESIANTASSPFRAAGRLFSGRAGADSSTETFWALKDVSFEVKRGEIVGVIGRNGAGKSTLLKVLSRITEPTTGHAEIHGRVGSLLEVGTGFHPELTGRDNVYLNGAILGMKRAEIVRQFDEIVAFAEVEKFIDTPVKHYSSGMYLRLAFAVAAHLEPEVLVVDEVLAVGDAEFQKKCLGKMQEVSEGGRTVLFVSHSMTAIVQLCDRCLLLKAGAVSLDGVASRVASAYFSDATASATGEFDLTSHPARSPQSTPTICRLRLYNARGTPSTSLYPDESCSIEIDYHSQAPIKDPRWAIAIEDYLGRRLLTLASYFQPGNISNLSGSGTVRCLIGPLSLGTGRYLISVSVGNKQRELIDSLDNAAWFEINWNNNFANGEPYSQIYGPILRQSHWETLYAS